MRLRWPVFLTRLTPLFRSRPSDVLRTYNLGPALESLFERRPLTFDCAERWPGNGRNRGRARVPAVGNQAPYLLTRSEELTLPTSDLPALTMTADSQNL